MYDLFDKMMCLHPVPRWFVAFLVIGLIAALAFVLISVCFMPFGFPLSAVIGGAIGCGIGTGLVNATFLSLG